jgi:hypothetical protein
LVGLETEDTDGDRHERGEKERETSTEPSLPPHHFLDSISVASPPQHHTAPPRPDPPCDAPAARSREHAAMNPTDSDDDRPAAAAAAAADSAPPQQQQQPLEWRFAQVFGERAAGEDVQEGTSLSCARPRHHAPTRSARFTGPRIRGRAGEPCSDAAGIGRIGQGSVAAGLGMFLPRRQSSFRSVSWLHS